MTGKVPKGYKQTEVGVIPAEWEVVAIGNHIDFISGYPFKSDEFSQDSSKTKLLRGINITEGNLRWNPEIDRYWSHVTPELTRYLLDESDLVIGMDGSKVGRNYAQVKSTDLPLLLVQRVARIRCLPSLFVEFLRHFVGSEFFTEYVDSVKTSSGIPHISAKQINEYTIPLPPLPEQKRIAEILSGVDATIESTRKVIDQTKKVKQGLLQELLTKGIGHTKFKDTEIGRIPAEWEVVRLGDISLSIDSGWSPQCDVEPADISEWGVLKTTAVVWSGYNENENKRLPSHLKPRKNIEVVAGDVLITRAGPLERVGVVVHIPQTRSKLMLSDKIIRIKTRSEACIGSYLSIYLSGDMAQAYLLQRKTGLATAQTNISQSILQESRMALPPLREQQQIAFILSSVDERITGQEKELSQLQTMKKGLMQDLLTGKVRVKV
jgi:type I restriction enzyme S subunit